MSVPPAGAMVNAYAPTWVGAFLHNILFGILIVQVYIYYSFFPKDKRSIKALVYSVFLIELAQTLMRAFDAYNNEVVHWGDPDFVGTHVGHRGDVLTWLSMPILTAISGGIVQVYFGYRIYIFSKSIWVASAIWLPALLQVGSGLGVGLVDKVQRHGGAANTKGAAGNINTTIVLTIWLVTTLVTDILIAGLLTYYLYSMKSGIKESDRLVTRIIRLTVETGSLTAVAAILIMILFYKKPPWHLMFSDIIGKLYANNLLVMFNRRHFLQVHGPISHSLGDITTTTRTGIVSEVEFASKSAGSRDTGEQIMLSSSQRGKYSFF
ncbi:hypothetical protein DL96DRAFT_1610160 [Flagelloscypha sp. PMI_526]|nr:hypothetical protein DL96DRAFT_1610160 [Flagelloscypha sp. PMI_526]